MHRLERWSVILGVATLVVLVRPMHAQDCRLGGQLGGAVALSDMPAGDEADLDATGGFSAAAAFGCDIGAVTLGVTPEFNDLGPVRVWHFLAAVGLHVQLRSGSEGPWLEPQLHGGIAVGDRAGSSVTILVPGRRVDLPRAAPAVGAALRLAFPMGNSGVGYVEPALRLAWFPTVDDGESAGAHTFATLPVRLGYAFRF